MSQMKSLEAWKWGHLKWSDRLKSIKYANYTVEHELLKKIANTFYHSTQVLRLENSARIMWMLEAK